MTIKNNVRELLRELPAGVELVAAVKGRRIEDVMQAVEAGIRIIGENYVQDGEKLYPVIGSRVQWHFIGHLQKNKVGKAIRIFDLIETVDSVELAQDISSACSRLGKTIPVLIEVNSGHEPQKHGVLPENAESLIRDIALLYGIRVLGLMTMGPVNENPAALRSCFAETRQIFDTVQRLHLPGIDMRYLSMGMSGSYRLALEEGANIVRIGTKIFGE